MDLLKIERREIRAKKRRDLTRRLKAGTATTKEYVAEIRRLCDAASRAREALKEIEQLAC